MNYPVWVVPYLGGSWVIGIMAIIHIFVSHFAVGGGIFIAFTEQLAYSRQDDRIYDYLKRHSLFFLLVTTVIGAVTGPGIWWVIALVSPPGTAFLIQNFTWFWSLEYLAFAAEITTFFVYYYTWNRISKEQHLQLAWLYFGISVSTLIIINGIITFMLTPGNWLTSHNIFEGFFNPTYWPSVLLRLLIMFGLAGMYALITSSRIRDDEAFRTYMLRYSAKWLLPIFFLGPLAGLWYFSNIPQAAIDTIFTGIHASGVGNFSVLARAVYLAMILSGAVIIFAFVGPYLNPKGFSFKAALIFLFFGLMVTGISEWSREMLRKPYVIYGYMYSNGILRDQIENINRIGFLRASKWALASTPTIPEPATMPSATGQGELIFRYQCMSCHTQTGYRSMKRLLLDRDRDAILALLDILHETDPKKNPYIGIMPPLAGTREEMSALADYLATINHPQKRI
ncbi:MAG TPA: cytochrome ubiquinol oxidase subunit I [Coleofasciculaceae cyanobacterium]|jgi:mono/diheme cytochrome c family protein